MQAVILSAGVGVRVRPSPTSAPERMPSRARRARAADAGIPVAAGRERRVGTADAVRTAESILAGRDLASVGDDRHAPGRRRVGVAGDGARTDVDIALGPGPGPERGRAPRGPSRPRARVARGQ